ncbi:MAG: glycosyltransferase family 2 protein [Verrucomicrobia bacterium]|nr:glycosyltransferase family 2 protein [Verrucomicrobiota bacterium]
MNSDLTVIIISFNSAEIITRCQSELLTSEKYPILIIDNASPDESAARLGAKFPSVEIVRLEKNRGYGRAANAGLCLTTTPYALLLNPDLTVTTNEIDALLRHTKTSTENTAVWGPATREQDFTAGPPQNVSWVSGSAMLFDVKKIKDLGLFDENIFLFSEETDLCQRAINAGHSIQFCPDVFFDHLLGQSSSPTPEIDYMKWWHFGWSQCYRMTKHGQCTLWENPLRKHLCYSLHSLLAISPTRRKKWRAKADGSLDFSRGEKAFTPNDTPQMSR